jgi:ABC-type cobalamin transport system permease subunit
MKAVAQTPPGPVGTIIRIVLPAALILLVPLLAMRFTDEVNWDLTDFAVVGALLIGTGLMYELASRKVSTFKYRAAVGVALVAALLLVWAELAVGIFGTPLSGS